MKRIIQIILPLLLVASPHLRAEEWDCLQASQQESNNAYLAGRMGDACEDAIFTCVSASMIGWGLGLAAGIMLLTGLIHQSTAAHSSSSSSN